MNKLMYKLNWIGLKGEKNSLTFESRAEAQAVANNYDLKNNNRSFTIESYYPIQKPQTLKLIGDFRTLFNPFGVY